MQGRNQPPLPCACANEAHGEWHVIVLLVTAEKRRDRWKKTIRCTRLGIGLIVGDPIERQATAALALKPGFYLRRPGSFLLIGNKMTNQPVGRGLEYNTTSWAKFDGSEGEPDK